MIENEHPNIANRDWRLQAITTLATPYHSPATGFVHPVGTVVQVRGEVVVRGRTIDIPFPSAPALYLSNARRAGEEGKRLLGEALQEVTSGVSGKLCLPDEREAIFFDALEQLIGCVIFSYSALECFANESIPPDFEHTQIDRKTGEEKTAKQSEIERWYKLETKLHEVLPLIFNVTSPKGTRVWEDYRTLEALRNRCIHVLSQDWRRAQQSPGNLWTKLSADHVPTAPKRVARMIAHYYSQEQPRWLAKSGLL
jgi:hypothetical protein